MTDANRPPDPQTDDIRTYYARPWLDRPTGRYTVEWMNGEQKESIRVHNRLTDFEGHRPSLASLMRVPQTVRTYFEAKRRTILERPLPFLVYEAIDHLTTLVVPGTRVLELGGSNSTLWFLAKGARVTTIEHSPDWAREIVTQASERFDDEVMGRLRVTVASGRAALRNVDELEDGSFDLALIDCMNEFTRRPIAVPSVVPKVRSGGTLCLDNSDHPNNWAAVTALGRDRRKRFTGLAPMCPVVTQTSTWVVP